MNLTCLFRFHFHILLPDYAGDAHCDDDDGDCFHSAYVFDYNSKIPRDRMFYLRILAKEDTLGVNSDFDGWNGQGNAVAGYSSAWKF